MLTVIMGFLTHNSVFIIEVGITLWLAFLVAAIILIVLIARRHASSPEEPRAPLAAVATAAGLVGTVLATPVVLFLLVAAGGSLPQLPSQSAPPAAQTAVAKAMTPAMANTTSPTATISPTQTTTPLPTQESRIYAQVSDGQLGNV